MQVAIQAVYRHAIDCSLQQHSKCLYKKDNKAKLEEYPAGQGKERQGLQRLMWWGMERYPTQQGVWRTRRTTMWTCKAGLFDVSRFTYVFCLLTCRSIQQSKSRWNLISQLVGQLPIFQNIHIPCNPAAILKFEGFDGFGSKHPFPVGRCFECSFRFSETDSKEHHHIKYHIYSRCPFVSRPQIFPPNCPKGHDPRLLGRSRSCKLLQCTVTNAVVTKQASGPDMQIARASSCIFCIQIFSHGVGLS